MLTKPDTEHSNGKHRQAPPETPATTVESPATESSPGAVAVDSTVGIDLSAVASHAISWHETAPRRVREAYALGSHADGWEYWVRFLARRNLPAPQDLLPAGRKSLAWGLVERLDTGVFNSLGKEAADIARVAKPVRVSICESISDWIAKLKVAPLELSTAVEAVAWAQALPKLAKRIEQGLWARLLDELVRLAEESQKSPAADPLIYQLTAGELPLTLAYQFPEIATCRVLNAGALQALTDCLAEVLDGEGLPNCRHLDSLRGLLACWTRCRVLGQQRPELCWDDTTQTQYRWVVRNALRLTRRDGRQVFSRADENKSVTKLFKAARSLANDADAERLASLMLGKRSASENKRKAGKSSAEIAPAAESEWSELAILRASWVNNSPSLAVAYGERRVRCELAVGSQLLAAGNWNLSLRVNDADSVQTSDWEQVCWVSDDDVDYLELEAQFTGEVCVQRQILLGRKDRFLLLADAVLASQATTKLDYTGNVALADGVQFVPADETREGRLSAWPAAVVLPLALPEWRVDPRGGALTAQGNALELRQSAVGHCMFAPLFIGLDRKWLGKQLTWRQLTVAEARQSQQADVAVGYRVQIGKLQWLIYRSLARPGTRTVLGQNLSSEFVVGRFHKTEPFSTYVDIEY